MHGLLRSLLQEQQHQQHDVHNINSNDDNTMSTNAPTNGTVAPIVVAGAVNLTDSYIEAELAEEVHVFDANASLALNATLIVCLLLAYYVKKFKVYYLTESAGALIVGMIIGGIARLTTDNLQLFEFVSMYTVSVCIISISIIIVWFYICCCLFLLYSISNISVVVVRCLIILSFFFAL